MKKKIFILTLSLMLTGTLSACSFHASPEGENKTKTDAVSSEKKEAAPTAEPEKESSDSVSDKTDPEPDDVSSTAGVQTSDTFEEIPEQGWNSIVLYDTDLNGVTVTRGDDGTGNWYDADGTSYGNLDEIEDESAPIHASDGSVYYWNGAYAEAAASS